MEKIIHKILYFLFALMYLILIGIVIKGGIILIAEMKSTMDFSMIIYIGIGIFILAIFILAFISSIKKFFEND